MNSPSSRAETTKVEIWTEGKTDWKHMKKAFAELERGAYISLHEREEPDMGDQAPRVRQLNA